MKILPLLFLITGIIFFGISIASAAPGLVINSTDKFLEKDGTKIVYVMIARLCEKYTIANTTPCSSALANITDFDGTGFEVNELNYNDSSTGDIVDDDFVARNVNWWGYTSNASNTSPKQQFWRSTSQFLGYSQDDEALYDETKTIPELNALYNSSKAIYPSGFVYAGLAPTNTSKYSHTIDSRLIVNMNYFDIGSWDAWSKQWTTSGYNITTDWAYGLEKQSEEVPLAGIPDLETWSKPVLGFATGACCGGYGSYSPQDMRFQIYTNFIFGSKGAVFYPYQTQQNLGVNSTYNFWRNQTKVSYVNNFTKEIHNDTWLFQPSTAKSWGSTVGNRLDTLNVTFTNDTTRVITSFSRTKTLHKFSYMLKTMNNTTSYLVITNKDINATVTTIYIDSLSNYNGNATTIGMESVGSGASGRVRTMTNGTFNDTVDGFTANVYEIKYGATNPEPPSTGEDTDTTSYRDFVFNDPGTYYVTVNASNANGSTQIINWTITVPSESASTPWTTGINGENFSSHMIGSNYTAIDGGTGSIRSGLVVDTFDDNNQEGWNKTGNFNGSFTSYQGALNQTGDFASYLYQNVSSYENMSKFVKLRTTNTSSSIDAGDLRGNISRGGFYQYSLGSPTYTRSSIYVYNGTSWILVNSSTEPLLNNTWYYTYFKIFGATVQSYIGNSYTDALSELEGQNTSTSIWLNGTTCQLGGQPRSNATISWDEVRCVPLDANGNQHTRGNYTLNYDIGAGNYIKNLTISSTLPANTNYSVYYRNASAGSYTLVGGLRTSTTEIVELPTPYYQAIDILLETNASQTDTFSINTIETEATDNNGIPDIISFTKTIFGAWE